MYYITEILKYLKNHSLLNTKWEQKKLKKKKDQVSPIPKMLWHYVRTHRSTSKLTELDNLEVVYCHHLLADSPET